MDRSAAAFGATLSVILAGLTSIASTPAEEPDVEGAVATALEHHLTDYAGVGSIDAKDSAFERIALCVGTKVPLAFDPIERHFAGTVVVPIPDEACTSETIEGDFGMFSAITRYRDTTGREAGHLELEAVSCSSSRSCQVDIDTFGSGVRYAVRRERGTWSVVGKGMRWVV